MRNKTPTIIQIDRASSVGFSITSTSNVDVLNAKLSRAGATWVTDLKLEFDSYLKKGTKYTFVLPDAFWAFNVGMYDVDVFSGCQLVQTVRLQYMQHVESSPALAVDGNTCADRAEANCDPVVDCTPAPCDVPDFCTSEISIDGTCGEGSAASDSTTAAKTLINNADVATNNSMMQYIQELTEELDKMVDAGYYYNSTVPLDKEMLASVAALKVSLEKAQVEPEATTSAAVIMQAELQSLTAQISRNMRTAAIAATRPETPAIKPNPVKRIVSSPSQKLADQIEEAFKNG